MLRRAVPTWEGFELVSWTAAVLAILLLLSPAWAPAAQGSWSAGTVRNVAPVISWTDASTLRASDANGEQDLFEIVLVTDDGARATIGLPLPVFQGVSLDGRDAYATVRDARPHDGALDVAWTLPSGPAPGLRAFAVDRAGATSNLVAFPAPPSLRPAASAAHAERVIGPAAPSAWS